MRLLLDINAGWERFVAHSPYYNILQAARADAECEVRLRTCGDAQIDTSGFDAVVSDRECGIEPSAWPPPETLSILIEVDIHRFTLQDMATLNRTVCNYDLIVGPYRFATFPTDLPHLHARARKRMVAWPHCVPDEPPPTVDRRLHAFMPRGRNPKPYPMLCGFEQLGLAELTLHTHPGYGAAEASAARAAWFGELAKHRVGIVGLGMGSGGYVVAKYVEYLHAGCLLLAERPSPLDCRLLGLRNGENCFLFDWPAERDRFMDIYEAARKDCTPFAQVAAAGQKLARDRHRASHRLAYLKRIVTFWRDTRRVPTIEEQFALANIGAT